MSNDNPDLAFLGTLETVIAERLARPDPQGSYVASLAARGERRIAQKLGEEAVELVLAAAGGERREQIEEAADLLFHLLVLLRAAGIPLAEVIAELRARHAGRQWQ